MNARHALVAVTLIAVAASPAGATVLSASNQAVGTRSSKADYLRVTEVQKDLNATMDEINAGAVAAGPLSASAPATGEAGYILQKDGPGGNVYPDDPFVGNPADDGLSDGQLIKPTLGRGQPPTDYSDNRRALRNRPDGKGRRGDPHAAPEPSTWMLLGAGLAMFGGFELLRRRSVI